jgi:3-methyladenine DNA glycosylase AlkD
VPAKKPKPSAATRRATTSARDAVAWLRKKGTKATRDGMARYAIPSDKAFGVTVGAMRAYAKKLGPDHALAQALWSDGHYESRMLACFVAEPALLTPAQMERWARDFDSWALCDTAAFHLFDRTPHAWKSVAAWAPRREEFVRRAAFALLASLALHDKRAGDAPFLRGLRLIERAAPDERNFVKKAVSWALRSTGRRNAALNAAAVSVAKRLGASTKPGARWVGKDALRELTSPAVKNRLANKRKSRATPRPS